MRLFRTLILGAAAVGCTGRGTGPSTPTPSASHPTSPTAPTDTDTDPDTDTTDPTDTQTDTEGLHGQIPATPLPPPQFTEVVSRSGAPASPDDLVGKPTVLWFYPAAFTGG